MVQNYVSVAAGRISSVDDLFARVLTVACVLNLNGVAVMMFDIGQVVSLLMLATAIVLVVRCGRAVASPAFGLLVATILTYLALGTLFFDPMLSEFEPLKYVLTYGGTILIVWGLGGYVAKLVVRGAALGYMAFLRNTFLLSAASVPVSPILYSYYVNLPPSAASRLGGFFGNPNEAAMAAAIALALTLAVPFRRAALQVAACALATGAVLLTFSKAGMSCAVLIWAWYLSLILKRSLVIFIPAVAAMLFWVVMDLESVVQAIVSSPLLELDSSQQGRLLQLADILKGRIDDRTSTGRTLMWSMVLERSWENFPVGAGIGSAHHIIGGVLEGDVWLGVHNTFLMLLGEAGPLPLLLFLAAIWRLAYSLVRYKVMQAAQFLMVVQILDMMATHGYLGVRFQNIVLALLLGLTATAALRSTLPRTTNLARLHQYQPTPLRPQETHNRG